MKLLFSLIIGAIFLGQTVESKEIFLITYDKSVERMKVVRRILKEEFSVPENIIADRKKPSPCSKEKAILQICISNIGELLFPVINRKVLDRSFRNLLTL